MGWFTRWLNKVDIGIRPRHPFKGGEVDIYPFTARGADWLADNLDVFTEIPTWSEWGRCLELSDIESLTLHLVVRKLSEAGLSVRWYGRLKGWDGNSPWLGE
jgi:hypothetical protein